ncbi:hypothetical protein BJV78DRAFT_960500 [Lactifluus subvellereus]|nr:hypothetical protein BJV78DRAFT_960500 [Lactifluus subvellereus]
MQPRLVVHTNAAGSLYSLMTYPRILGIPHRKGKEGRSARLPTSMWALTATMMKTLLQTPLLYHRPLSDLRPYRPSRRLPHLLAKAQFSPASKRFLSLRLSLLHSYRTAVVHPLPRLVYRTLYSRRSLSFAGKPRQLAPGKLISRPFKRSPDFGSSSKLLLAQSGASGVVNPNGGG